MHVTKIIVGQFVPEIREFVRRCYEDNMGNVQLVFNSRNVDNDEVEDSAQVDSIYETDKESDFITRLLGEEITNDMINVVVEEEISMSNKLLQNHSLIADSSMTTFARN
ncbi:heat-inducible transcription repressor HrcA [Striga asiatica]|uniref:Heat-inducible transcription repressor HrcA n=1 Tax=Striga asiatica TaxID=4170 RepID=A0A5A7RKS2_STRAF|nr:heat-inducible transcription repressor HrcA [Striga asiatica]